MSSVRGRAAQRSAGQTHSDTHEYALGRGPDPAAVLAGGAELQQELSPPCLSPLTSHIMLPPRVRILS